MKKCFVPLVVIFLFHSCILADFFTGNLVDVAIEEECVIRLQNNSESMVAAACYIESTGRLKKLGLANKDSMWTCLIGTVFVPPNSYGRLYLPHTGANDYVWRHFFDEYCIDTLTLLVGNSYEDLVSWSNSHTDSLVLKCIDITRDDINEVSKELIFAYP